MTWSRSQPILAFHVGETVLVHNGKTFAKFVVRQEMVGREEDHMEVVKIHSCETNVVLAQHMCGNEDCMRLVRIAWAMRVQSCSCMQKTEAEAKARSWQR